MVGTVRWTPIVALVLLVCPGSAGAGDSVDTSRLDAELRHALESGAEELRVIVHLHAPPEARIPLSPRGVQQPPARLATVHETTTQVVGELLEGVGVPDVLEIHHTSPLRPMFAATVTRDGLRQVLERTDVAWIEHDEVMFVQTEQGVDLIGAGLLHDLGVTGQGAAVAVIDSGVDYLHPALGGGEIPNGKVVYGKDTGDNDDDPMDCQGHGTAVAGIAAGLPYEWPDGSEAFAGGVAPGAAILAYKAMRMMDCSEGSFYSSNVTAAIDDAILQRDAYNVVAINLSLGGGIFSQGPCDVRSPAYAWAIRDAVEAGIAVFAAAGNDAKKEHLAAPACIGDAIAVGSVYDENSVSFGLDFGECRDSKLVPKTPTCYANSSPYLDLLAPSEPLESVAWNGKVTSFGGTSGATPYAVGSAALLAELAAGQGIGVLSPGALRSLLKVTGEPIIDPANDTVSSLVDLEAAAQELSGAAVQIPEADDIPNDGTPIVSTTVVSRSGLVRGVKVALDLLHPSPSELAVTLTAPDGTRVVLHDHGPGSTVHEATAMSGHDGLSVVYPDDREPVQPFERLDGVLARGVWTLEVVDEDPNQQFSGVSPRFLGWNLQLVTESGPESTTDASAVIPVSAHASGANNTFWVTDVRILNPDPGSSLPVRLFFVPQEQDGTGVFSSVALDVPANTVISLPDVLSSRFGVDSGQGSLLVQPQAAGAVIVTSRTYNTGASSGTFGQFIGRESLATSIGAGSPQLWLVQLASTGDFHTNIGFAELSGHETTVELRLHDGDTGDQLGDPLIVTVPPFSNVQRNFVFATHGVSGTENAYATAEVVSGGGRVVAYASVVDDRTGDAIAVPGRHAPQAFQHVVPIVAKSPGANGTSWVSDVRVVNTSDMAIDVELVVTLPEGEQRTLQRAVGSKASLALQDVVGEAFALASGSGSLRVVAAGGETGLIVTSRTYNQAASGTFGQFIPAVTDGFSTDDRPVVMHLDASDTYRTNIGICEISGGSVSVRYVLKSSTGSTLGIGRLELGPYQVRQINDVFEDVGASAEENVRVDLLIDGGDGVVTAYGSVVDNLSGDAIFVPAEALQAN